MTKFDKLVHQLYGHEPQLSGNTDLGSEPSIYEMIKKYYETSGVCSAGQSVHHAQQYVRLWVGDFCNKPEDVSMVQLRAGNVNLKEYVGKCDHCRAIYKTTFDHLYKRGGLLMQRCPDCNYSDINFYRISSDKGQQILHLVPPTEE